MNRNTGARVLLVFAGLACALAYSSWILSRTVLDAHNTKSLASNLLATTVVHDKLANQATRDLTARFGDAAADPRVTAAIDQALDDPRFVAAFSSAIAQFHEALLESGPRRVTIDPNAFAAALERALGITDPQLARAVANVPPVQLQLGSNDAPSLHGLREQAGTITIVGLLAGLILLALALLLDNSRKMVGRIGRRITYLAALPLMLFFAVPLLVGPHGGEVAQVASVVLRSYRAEVLPSALAITGLGIGIVLATWFWPRRFPIKPEVPPQPNPQQWNDQSSLTATRPAGSTDRLYL